MVCAVHSQSQLISPTSPTPTYILHPLYLHPYGVIFFFPKKIGQGNNPLKKKKKTENKAPKEKRLLHLEY